MRNKLDELIKLQLCGDILIIKLHRDFYAHSNFSVYGCFFGFYQIDIYGS